MKEILQRNETLTKRNKKNEVGSYKKRDNTKNKKSRACAKENIEKET